MRRKRFVSRLLLIAISLSLLSNVVYAAPEDDEGTGGMTGGDYVDQQDHEGRDSAHGIDWRNTNSVPAAFRPISVPTVLDDRKKDLDTAILEFEKTTKMQAGAAVTITAYTKVLVAADWFTNNYYLYDGTEHSAVKNTSGEVNEDWLEQLNTIPGMAETIAAIPGLDSNSAFNKRPENVDENSLVAYDGYREALFAIAKDYIVPGINEQLSGITWDDSWTITGTQTEIKEEMVTALASKRAELEPYAKIYNMSYAHLYGDMLTICIKSETQTVNNNTIEVVGYTRAELYDEFVSDEIDAKVRTICTWLSQDNGSTGDNTNSGSVSDGIVNVDTSKGVLGALANAELIDGEVVTASGEELDLTSLGYYVLAAGIAYDPFVSYAGNDSYMALLKDFLDEAGKTDELIRTLQVAVNTKKPLYKIESTLEEWTKVNEDGKIPVGNYTEARLQDLLESDKRVIRAYVCMLGDMRPSTMDSSTFDYVRKGSGTSSYTDDTAVKAEDANATGDLTQENKQGIVTVGSDKITASADQVTAPILYTAGNSYSHFKKQSEARKSQAGEIAGLTTMILTNASKDCRDNIHIQQAATEMIFVNGLGDIVLSDGTVILPAIANPALYSYEVDNTALEDAGTSNTSGGSYYLNYSAGYYPYHASMLNHYPQAAYDGPDKVKVQNPNDEGKYIMSYIEGNSMSDGGFEVTKIKNSGNKQVDVNDITTLPSVFIAAYSFNVRADVTDIANQLPFIKMPQGMWRSIGNNVNKWMTWGLTGIGNVGDANTFEQRYLQAYAGGRNQENIPYFPLVTPEIDQVDSWLGQAKPLVTSAVRYVSTRNASNELAASGKFRVQAYITDLVAQGMTGTQYAEQMIKNNQLSYEELVENQYGRFSLFVKNLVADAINTVGHIDGVLSIKDGYGNGFFNTVMGFVQEFYLVIAIILVIIIATKFIKGHFSFFYVAAIGCLTFAAFNVYAVWMPTAVPAIYNFFVNDIVEEVTWNTVATTAEKYSETYMNANSKDASTGRDRPYTATITLYKMTQAEMEQVAEHANVDIAVIRKGDILWLDRTGGIFVQGDQIKMSVDSLLANNTMRGLYLSQWETLGASNNENDLKPVMVDTSDNPYVLKLTEPYVSLETYYTPFSHFERAFLINLNNFASIFRVERNYYQYPGGLYKDAFLFNAYTDSGIFTAPGNDDVLNLSILPNEIMGNTMARPQDIINLCHQSMDPFEDWMNLRAVFVNPNDAMKASLWGRMMQNQGYYGADWSMTIKQEEKISDLIFYINLQTKQFIINNQDQLNFLSDENAIKLVTLYATTCFTHRVSSFGYWLYPNYVNSCDIELVDVLYGAMTTYRDRNAALDGDLVNTVMLNLGVIGILLILVITVVATVFVFILTYLVPVLYAMFGVILVYKLVNNEQGTGLVKGYVKVTAVSTFLYMLFSFSLRLVKFGGYRWYGYLMSAILSILCLYFLFFVVLSVVTNPLELGNDVLMRNLFGALDRLTGGRLGRLTSNSLTINSRRTYGYGAGATRGFLRGDSVDDRWSGRTPRRGYGGYSRYDDYDDTGMLRGRVFGSMGGHLDGYSRTQTGYRNSTGRRGLFNRRGSAQSNDSWGGRFDNFKHRSSNSSDNE